MKQNGAPWIIALLALLTAAYPASKGPGSAVETREETAAKAPSALSPSAGATVPGQPPASPSQTEPKDLLRPLRDFFTSAPPSPARPGDLAIVQRTPGPCSGCEYKIVRQVTNDAEESLTILAVAEASKAFQVKFLIALVADPIDSNVELRFDQQIEAIQAAFVDQGFLPDRFWLPWKTEAGQQDLFRRMPGIWLFTRAGSKQIQAVLLVGETPKIGVQKVALREAIDFERRFNQARGSGGGTVKILGPSFSGSAPSLRRVLDEAGLTPAKDMGSDSAATYRIVTGTATAKGLTSLGGEAAFHRTVVPDDVLQEDAFSFLQQRMGWDLSRVALLVESDTSYGRGAATAGGGAFEVIFFPSGLSKVRDEWAKNGDPRPSAGPVEIPRSTLSLELGGFNRPVDLVPEFSPLSARSKDLVIANLLTAISGSGIRYVGILATDARDKLFLARRIREFSPDVILFTFDNSLLYAHPEYAPVLDGTLVLSSFPLFTEHWSQPQASGGPVVPPQRRQFASGFEQGTFQATLELLKPGQNSPPRTWISTVGNGSLWPLADLPMKGQTRPRGEWANLDIESVSTKIHLQLWLFELVLVALGWWLWRTSRVLFGDCNLRTQGSPLILLTLGLGVLWICAAVLLVLDALPALQFSWGRWLLTGLLTVLTLTYAVALVLAGSSGGLDLRKTLARRVRLIDILPVVLLWGVIIAFPWLLYRLWVPDRLEFFYFRARKFSSGLSPVVSLLLWSAAVYAWVYLEVRRRLVGARRSLAWPYPAHRHPPLVRCATLARSCRDHLVRRLPPRAFWIAFAVVAGPPAVFLATTVQPVAEPRGYGPVFTLLIVFALTLGAVSFYRFVAIWLTLQKVLDRLNHTPLIEAFKRISPQVGWTPMKSFGWQMPSFNLMVLSAEKLRKLPLPFEERKLDIELERLFEAERQGDLRAELAVRRELNLDFSRQCRLLARQRSLPVEDFLAVRLVAYIRHAFFHMHYCLNQALAAGLLLMLAVRLYEFEPKQFFSLCLWAFLVPAVFCTLWIFLEMDRNASLSAIGGTAPGRVTFNRDFLTNFFSYGLLPLFGILVSFFPQASRWLAGLINPLLNVTGIG